LLAIRNIPPANFRPDSTLAAGLRVRLNGACLDGTTGGLLARREAVIARLLAHWEIEASGNGQTGDGCNG
jgi:hypothetical protein